MSEDVARAWQAAQDAWEAAGKTLPCYDPTYLAARDELAAAHRRSDHRGE